MRSADIRTWCTRAGLGLAIVLGFSLSGEEKRVQASGPIEVPPRIQVSGNNAFRPVVCEIFKDKNGFRNSRSVLNDRPVDLFDATFGICGFDVFGITAQGGSVNPGELAEIYGRYDYWVVNTNDMVTTQLQVQVDYNEAGGQENFGLTPVHGGLLPNGEYFLAGTRKDTGASASFGSFSVHSTPSN